MSFQIIKIQVSRSTICISRPPINYCQSKNLSNIQLSLSAIKNIPSYNLNKNSTVLCQVLNTTHSLNHES